ncbi:hypothetical protein P3T76_010412 [Phytophthora citrophthora]|uniref:Uncharacterized protein n=1 Tax=Phytophthora citrophthora TaxID=4793 RepID=A0AAD9GCC5_9STRA|nr:hypothetical protein P3T76_010412 [Phytophthora citrophthora]
MLHPRPTSDLKVEPTRKKRATTPRIRNKARIELLRQEIEVLEAELEALQRRKQMTGVLATTLKKSTPDPLWKAIATRQSKERERALRCNEQLREMIAEQQMLTVLLSGVLTEWISNPDQAYL